MESSRPSSQPSPATSPSPFRPPRVMRTSVRDGHEDCISAGERPGYFMDNDREESPSEATHSIRDETPLSDLYRSHNLLDEQKETIPNLWNRAAILQWSAFSLIASIIIAITLRYIAQPPVVHLPLHTPIAELPSALRSLASPWTDLRSPGELYFGDFCHCPLKWRKERRRYDPEPGGLYDFDLWKDVPKDLPGRMYPLDETEMDILGASCEELVKGVNSIPGRASDIRDLIEKAYSDSLRTISKIAYRLRIMYSEDMTDQDAIMGVYLSELGAAHLDSRSEQIPVEDPNFPKSRHQRKNPRAFTVEEVSIREERFPLHSLSTLAAKLSDLSNFTTGLLSQSRGLQSRITVLLKDPQNEKSCRIIFDDLQPESYRGLENVSRLARHHAAHVRDMLERIDALRVSLDGFHRGKVESALFWSKFRYLSLLPGNIPLEGDHWQATWAWMGLNKYAWAARTPSSSTTKAVRYIKKWLPRHPIQLSELKAQYEALSHAFRVAKREAKVWGRVPDVADRFRGLMDGLGMFA